MITKTDMILFGMEISVDDSLPENTFELRDLWEDKHDIEDIERHTRQV